MFVKDCMTRHPILIAPKTLATEAQKIMSENNVRHLPVVGDGKRLKGLVTRQSLAMQPDVLASLNVWEITRYLSDLRVSKVMIRNVQTIREETTVEEAAKRLMAHKVGCLPVLDEDKVVIGVLTEVDLLQAFQEMLGLPFDGVRVTIRMPNRAGEFAKLAKAIGENQFGIMGIGTFPTRRHDDSYDAVLKIRGASMDEVKAVFATIATQTIVDIREVV